MKILVIEPGKVPVERDIEESLSVMQEIVGGTIQAIYPFGDTTALLCNDDGILLGLPKNRAIYTDDAEVKDIIYGTFFLCDAPADTEHFSSLSDSQLRHFKGYFAMPERFYQHSGHLVIVRDHVSEG